MNEQFTPSLTDLHHVPFEAAPIDMPGYFVRGLENVPVLYKTGLTGKYDFQLEFSRASDEPLPPGVSMRPANDAEPPIFDALNDQLGLKLVRIKPRMDKSSSTVR